MTAALLIVVILNPVCALILAALSIWAAKAGVLTLRKPTRPRPAKETQP